MRLSDLIADFINSALNEEGGVIELQRGELADRFNCVPSQINYVIETRFSPELGFFVESRRGGGGYIRISRVQLDRPSAIMHIVNAIGDQLDAHSSEVFITNMRQSGVLNNDNARMISAVTSDRALITVSPSERNRLRANILKIALLATSC